MPEKVICPICGKDFGDRWNARASFVCHMKNPGKGFRAAHNLSNGLAANGGRSRKR